MSYQNRWHNYIYTVKKLKRNELIQKTQTTSVEPGIYYPKSCGSYSNKRCKEYRRTVFRNGEINIQPQRSTDHNVSNYFFRLVKIRWQWTLINFSAIFTLTCLVFAMVYWIISFQHGDFNREKVSKYQNISRFTPCIENMYSFSSAFLFSVEVQSSVAYGHKSLTLECPETIAIMCFQCIMSSVMLSIMFGILFAKLTKPLERVNTIMFSRHAVIHLRDDKFCFIFRVGNIRKLKIINMKPKAYILRFVSEHNELRDFEQIELKLVVNESDSTCFLWPLTVVHIIDGTSPFYGLSAPDLLCCDLEILAVFEGVMEYTGLPIQARTSYTKHDILWGHRFSDIIGYNFKKRVYDIDISKLTETNEIDTPLCSACEYYSILATIFNKA